MSAALIGVIIGGILGIIGTLSTTIITSLISDRRRAKAIRLITKGELVAIKEKAERFIEGQSSEEGLSASTPLLTSLASELGFLTEKHIIAFRRVVTLDMEMRTEKSIEKAVLVVIACKEALRDFSD